MEIKHPEWLQLTEGQQTLYGYNQEWYTTSYQRTRGCGPTVGAMLLYYLNIRAGRPLPYSCRSITEVIKVLDDVWKFITPFRFMGLSSTKKFYDGIENLFRHYHLDWKCHRLSIPLLGDDRPSLAQTVQFVETAFKEDSPVAFLNLHRGKVSAFDSWHWILVIALDYDEKTKVYTATCYDGGRRITFDLGLWLETTWFGGGFAYVTVG